MYLLASAVGLLASAWGPADGISGEPAGIRGGYFHIFLCKPVKAEYFVDSNYLRKPFEYMVFTDDSIFHIFLKDFEKNEKFLKRFWEILIDFERFWEILRDFEKFWKISKNFEKFWEIFTSPSNTTLVLQWFTLRNFEKFWEILRKKIP